MAIPAVLRECDVASLTVSELKAAFVPRGPRIPRFKAGLVPHSVQKKRLCEEILHMFCDSCFERSPDRTRDQWSTKAQDEADPLWLISYGGSFRTSSSAVCCRVAVRPAVPAQPKRRRRT